MWEKGKEQNGMEKNKGNKQINVLYAIRKKEKRKWSDSLKTGSLGEKSYNFLMSEKTQYY